MKDKILFWIFSDFTHFGLSKFFQDNHECELYAIYDVTNNLKNYFQKQKLVKFEKEFYLHDHIQKNEKNIDLEYLKSIENKYNLELLNLAFNERQFYHPNSLYKFKDNEVLLIIEQECKLFEKVLDDIKPDYVLMHPPNFHNDQIFSVMCKHRKIKTRMLGFSRFGRRSIITSEFDKFDDQTNEINENEKVRSQKELLDYLKGFDYHADNVEFASNLMSSKYLMIKALFHYLLLADNNTNLYTYYGRTKINALIFTITLNIKEKFRESFMNSNLEKTLPHDSPFLYFPLQLDQENGLLLGAPFYTNQLEVIRTIAKSLPVGYKLYVKEHPVMNARGWRPTSFYKEIMDLPHVKLFHPGFSNEQILKNCSAVITISSTAGMEAAFYGKPSIVFVDVLYSMLQSVHKLNSYQDLPAMIKTILQTKVNESDVNKFVNYFEKRSFEFDLFGFTTKSSNYFRYGGFLHDMRVDDNIVLSFLKDHKPQYESLMTQYLKSMHLEKKQK